MLFLSYMGLMGFAVLLSLFNAYKGDRRLLALASKYAAIVTLFHLIFMTWLHIQTEPEFPLLVAGAQGLIAYESHKIGCRAAKIITPLAWISVFLNIITFAIPYPHAVYYYSQNLLQGSEVASLIFASSIWYLMGHGIVKLILKIRNSYKGMSYERAG